MPLGRDERSIGYVGFGDTYGPDRDEAVRRRWPMNTLARHYLHMLAEPELVANELVAHLR